MNFSIYSSSVGGVPLYYKLTNVTTDTSGVYNTILDNINLNFSEQYYLGITVENDAEMSPRINLTSSPYAYMAQNVSAGGIIYDGNVDMGLQNITTTGTGFFGFLGNLATRISKLWVEEINASGNIVTMGNVSAGYFIGNASQMVGLPSGGGSSGAGWANDSSNTNTSLNVNVGGDLDVTGSASFASGNLTIDSDGKLTIDVDSSATGTVTNEVLDISLLDTGDIEAFAIRTDTSQVFDTRAELDIASFGVLNQIGIDTTVHYQGTNSGSSLTQTGTKMVITGNTGTGSKVGYDVSLSGSATSSYGFRVAILSGADNNWGYYNNAGANNFMGGDNSKTMWGTTNTDLQISSDGINGVINVSNRLDVLGDLNVTGTIYGSGIGGGSSGAGWANDSLNTNTSLNVNIGGNLTATGTLNAGQTTILSLSSPQIKVGAISADSWETATAAGGTTTFTANGVATGQFNFASPVTISNTFGVTGISTLADIAGTGDIDRTGEFKFGDASDTERLEKIGNSFELEHVGGAFIIRSEVIGSGTLSNPGNVTIGQTLLNIQGRSTAGSAGSYRTTNRIMAKATENHNIATGLGTEMQFWTTPNGAVFDIEQMILEHDGTLNLSNNSLITTGNVTATYFYGNASQMVGLPTGTGDADYSFGSNSFSGTGNFTTTGNVTANYFIGDGSQLTGVGGGSSAAGWANDSLNTNTSLNVNVGGNLNVTGLIYGNASQMVGLPSAGGDASYSFGANSFSGTGNFTTTGDLIANQMNLRLPDGGASYVYTESPSVSKHKLVVGDIMAGDEYTEETEFFFGSARTVFSGTGVNGITWQAEAPLLITTNVGALTLSGGGGIVFQSGTSQGDGTTTTFGAGIDMTLKSDGTNGIISFATAGRLGSATVNYLEVSPTGNLEFYGSSNTILAQGNGIGFGSEALTTTGNVTAAYFFGNASQMVGLPTGTGDADYSFGANNFIGTGGFTTTGLGTFGNLNITGNITQVNEIQLGNGVTMSQFNGSIIMRLGSA